MAAATDFRKTLDSYRAKAGEFRILDLPPRQYLMIDGRGDPNTSAYSDAISTIYPVAYKLKFASEHAGRDYVVPPLEALWSAPDMAAFTSRRDKSQWDWTLLNLVPDWVTQADVDEAVRVVATRSRPPGLEDVRLETLEEGRCVQTLHLGPFDDEAETLARMHDEFIPGAGAGLTGRHHEIYFSDTRKVDPAKFRTILRQPVAATDLVG
ncbi:MAG: GyrI-like domain-containing protein [Pseudolysinimonas sp.]|uniref:GyrI-like domain-containing protein n=1 Tax=Pseudolysinimonas sp. TaxID=2680009 RepID=UPI003C78522D